MHRQYISRQEPLFQFEILHFFYKGFILYDVYVAMYWMRPGILPPVCVFTDFSTGTELGKNCSWLTTFARYVGLRDCTYCTVVASRYVR